MKTNKSTQTTPSGIASGAKLAVLDRPAFKQDRQPIQAENPQLRMNPAHRQENRQIPTPQLLELLSAKSPELFDRAEVVGNWVWISFDDAPPRPLTAMLAELGFHWNRTRKVWQHPCGHPSRKAEYDPHRRYGSHPASEVEMAR